MNDVRLNGETFVTDENGKWSAESIELDQIIRNRIIFCIGYENYFRDPDSLYGSLSPEDAIKLGENLIELGNKCKSE
jgi:hypothetical protein